MPARFGKCEISRPLGRGATAVVYLATHSTLEIPVAVKVLHKKLSDRRPEYAARFLREARTAAWLGHPNIVRVIDCGVEDGYHYMVMDYVDGPNCYEQLHEYPDGLHWREAIEIIRQAANGLAYAAERDIIHRDVKPSNIMIDSSGRVRVTDLGLAKLTIKGLVELTSELHTFGTPNYMSPEQIRAPSRVDLRSDIYSLGATFYHMVTGRPPFLGKSSMEVIAKHLTSKLRPPIQVKPDLPEAVSSMICKMMAKKPEERYQDYDELAADISNVIEGRGTSADGFRDVHASIADEQEVRQLLEELSFGVEVQIELDEPSGETETEGPTQEKSETTSAIVPFGPEESIKYEPSTEEDDGDTKAPTVLLRRRAARQWSVLWLVVGALAAVGVIGAAIMLLAR